jgi:hypothetical protein
MGDAWTKGGRAGGRGGLSGEDKLRPHRNYDEHWMERAVHGLYESAVDEPVPKDMLDIVRRLPLSEPSSEETTGRRDERMAGENRRILRKNVRDLHRLLDFKAEDSKEERIVMLLAEPRRRKPPGSPVSPTKSNQPPDAPSPDAMDRARRWRAKAEECRTAGESMNSEAARNALLQLARDYEALAESQEQATHQRGGRERDAG